MVSAIRLPTRHNRAVSWSPRSRPVWIAFALAFLIGLFVFGSVLRHETNLKISDAAAIEAARADPNVSEWLRSSAPTRVDVIPLDRENARVSFFRGQRAVAEVAVSPEGKVIAFQALDEDYIRAGNFTIQHGLLLLAAAFGFLALSLRKPVVSLVNGDLLALAALTLTIWTVNGRLFAITMLLGVALMAYLLARCLMIAARPAARPQEFLVGFGGEDSSLMRVVVIACGILAVMTTIPGGVVGDVSQASVSGATQILEGRLPYGNIMDGVVHGDTYPIFAYVLYAPASLIWPVHDLFDNLGGGLWIAAIALLAGAVGIFRAGRSAAGEQFGLRQAAAWLIFPPVLVTASAGANDLPTAALVVWAIATWTHAGRTSTWLSAAAWAKVVPVFVLPLWLARFRGATLGRALAAPVVLTAIMLGLLIGLGGSGSVKEMFDAIAFQSDRGAQLSFWVVTGAPTVQVIVQAAALALAAASAAAVWVFRDLGESLVRVCALAAAVMLAFQIGASYWSYAYVPWVYPLLAVALLWPRPEPAAQEQAESPRTITS